VNALGRWSLLRPAGAGPSGEIPAAPSTQAPAPADLAEFVARRYLRRTGVVFRKTIVREKVPVFWRDLVRVLRTLEARGDVRGGRFVAGFSGEQYALPEAVPLLRAIRKRGEEPPRRVLAADPLNFQGILTPDERVSPMTRREVLVG
jgi:ATP-dependent Lhr-like helicase